MLRSSSNSNKELNGLGLVLALLPLFGGVGGENGSDIKVVWPKGGGGSGGCLRPVSGGKGGGGLN